MLRWILGSSSTSRMLPLAGWPLAACLSRNTDLPRTDGEAGITDVIGATSLSSGGTFIKRRVAPTRVSCKTPFLGERRKVNGCGRWRGLFRAAVQRQKRQFRRRTHAHRYNHLAQSAADIHLSFAGG